MATASFRDFVLDQLSDLALREVAPDDEASSAPLRARSRAGLVCRAMFGGHGLYFEGAFFAILWHDRLFLKTAPEDRPAFAAHGSEPFRPAPGQALHSYYEVPLEVLEDPDELVAWARRAIRAARLKASGRNAAPRRASRRARRS